MHVVSRMSYGRAVQTGKYMVWALLVKRGDVGGSL